MSIEEYLFPLNVMIEYAARTDCVSVHLLLGERGVVQARSEEQDFLTQTKFQSDEDSFLMAFSVFVAMTFLRGIFGPVDEGMYSP